MIIKCTEIKTIKTKDSYINKLLKESFFFDIETTGLSHKYSNIVSITTLLMENNIYKIYQLFCEYSIDEKEIIKYFNELIKEKKYVITYNGNNFDIPFLMNKYNHHKIEFNLDCFVKIDLYNDMRHLRNKIEINDLKLKTVEKYFNIKRDEAITGQDVTILYEAYKIEPRKEFAEMILQHNYEDVFNLQVLFKNIFNLYDSIIHINDELIVKINFSDFSFKKNTLLGNFYVISNFNKDYVHQALNFDLKLEIKSQLMKISIPISFFKDQKINEFYYLNNNDFNMENYTTIDGIKKNLIPLKFNGKIYHENILTIINSIITSIF